MENLENMESVVIAAPEEKDMLDVQQAYYKSWMATYPNEEFGITREDVDEWFKDKFTDEALARRWDKIESKADVKTFVAKEGDIVMGFIVVSKKPDKNHLDGIYISPEYQGKGIGKKLWQEARSFFDMTKPTVLECATYNTNAISFYKKLGFKDTGKHWQNDESVRMKSGNIIPQLEMELAAQ